jgi:hypothetical protein
MHFSGGKGLVPPDCDRLQFLRVGAHKAATKGRFGAMPAPAFGLAMAGTLPILNPCLAEGESMQAAVFALNTPELFAIRRDDPKGPPSAPPAIPPIIINPFSYQTPSPAIDPRVPPPGPPVAPPPDPRQRL